MNRQDRKGDFEMTIALICRVNLCLRFDCFSRLFFAIVHSRHQMPTARCALCKTALLRPATVRAVIPRTLICRNATTASFAASSFSSKPPASKSSQWNTFFSTPLATRLRDRTQKFLPEDEVPASTSIARPVQQQITSDRSVESKSAEELLSEGWRPIAKSYSAAELLKMYMQLSKAKLAALVVLTTMAGYAICPVDPSSGCDALQAFVVSLPGGVDLSDLAMGNGPSVATSAYSLTLPTLLSTTVGTLLCICSANTFNQMSEVPYDAQMLRTRNRVLVRRLLSPLHAFSFAATTGIAGVSILWTLVNPLTASLGLANIILYSFIYTPLKRMHIVNTWVGALVGALPPMMGWAACTGSIDPITQPGAWALFALLFAWQFPHFNPLAHTLRRDYARAGYKMMSVTNPLLNARVGLRYAISFFPICAAFPALGLTNQWFALLSAIPNAALAWTSYRFWRSTADVINRRGSVEEQAKQQQSRNKEAKWAFWASVVHLPGLLVLMMVCKVGLWTRLKERWERMVAS